MKKNGFLTMLCMILFLFVCECGSGDSAASGDSVTSDDSAASDAFDDSDIFSDPVFAKQPKSMNIAPNNQSVALVCEVKAGGRNVKYQWYSSSDGTTDAGTAISGATGTAFETPVFTEKGVRYYYCVATVISESVEEPVMLVSNVASVAYTALPTLYINTPDAVEIVSKEEWIKNAEISLVGAADKSWNFDEVATSIKGRGNTSWVLPKKPYALKLDKKQKIMGMPAHKQWVLLANYQDNSFMRNKVAFYLSEIFELDWTVHGEFVDLVLNGEYLGLYWLGEAIKVDKKRVDINDGNSDITDEEDKDYLVEMDVYYDEIVQFKSSIRELPYIIKNDDYMIDENDEITSGGAARLERFQAKITNLEKLLYPDWTEGMDTNDCSAPDESYSEIIDIDSWARFWFVNEIMDNTEMKHPKSCYFTFDSTNNVFKAGPVWDFDWASLHKRSACMLKDAIYYNALFKSPAFNAKVKELWDEYYSRIDIETLIESMRSKLSTAVEYDTMLWGEHDDPTGVKRENFDAYVDFFKERVLSKISIINEDDVLTNRHFGR